MSPLRFRQAVIRAIVFDFDGTLAKLNIDFDEMRRAVGELLDSFGVPPHRLSKRHVLEQIHEAESILSGQPEHSSRVFVATAYRLIEEIEMSAAASGEIFDGVRPLLDTLRTNGIRTGVITRNCKQAIQTVFPDLHDVCDIVLCREDVEHVKPHPDHLGRAISMLDAKPEETIMIGDHPLDIETGQTVGTFTIGVLTGRCKRDDFIKAGADEVLESVRNLLSELTPTNTGLRLACDS